MSMNIVTCREKQRLLLYPRGSLKAALTVYFIKLKSLYPEVLVEMGLKVTTLKLKSFEWCLLGVSLTQNLPLE